MDANDPEGGKRPSGCAGCGKALAIGCGVVLVFALLVAVGVAMNWQAIKESGWFRAVADMAAGAKTEMGRMMELRERLLADYPADNVNVRVLAHHTWNESTQAPATALVVTFDNPRFDPPGVGDDALRPIAELIARTYPEIERYDFIQISIRRRVETGVTVSSSVDVSYPVADLLGGVRPEAGGEAGGEKDGSAEESPPPY